MKFSSDYSNSKTGSCELMERNLSTNHNLSLRPHDCFVQPMTCLETALVPYQFVSVEWMASFFSAHFSTKNGNFFMFFYKICMFD